MRSAQQRRERPYGRAIVVTVLLTGMMTAVLPPFAHAAVEDPIAQRVEKLAADAAVAYHGADYAKAVELLDQAYKLRQMPVLLYNLAKAYDKLGDQDRAIELYRRYSALSDADVSLRARADARIAAYEDMMHRRVIPPRRPDIAKPPPPVETPEQRAVRLWVERRRRDRRIGVGLVTTGGLCLLGAIGLSAGAYATYNGYRSQLGTDAAQRSARDRAFALAVTGDVLYGVAAVSAGIGAYFAWRGYHPEHAPGLARVTSLAPWLSPRDGVVGLAMGGTF